MKCCVRCLLLLQVLVVLYSCKQATPEKIDLSGVYEQLGYGRVAVIEGETFTLYDVTSKSCIPILKDDISIYGDRLKLQNDTLKVADGINLYQFVRLADTPTPCETPFSDAQLNDPLFNFEVLAEYFDAHYAYFEERDVNWDSLKQATRIKITAQTSEVELYNIFEDLLNHFNDGHLGLGAPDEIEEAAYALREAKKVHNAEPTQRMGDLEIASRVAEAYVTENLKSSRSELIKWGFMEKEIGFIQVNLMMGHGNIAELDAELTGMPYLRAYFDALDDFDTSEAHTNMEVEGIRSTMIKALQDLEASDALVLDVRFNGGGKDEVALEILSFFNESQKTVFTKKAQMDSGFTPKVRVDLEAKSKAYTKPVFILTSQESASATEIMVLSSLSLDHAFRMGSRTEGVFSDVMEKALPNGWELGLSNEVYQDLKGKSYEHIGITPDVHLDYPAETQTFYRLLADDLEADKQSILEALKQLQSLK